MNKSPRKITMFNPFEQARLEFEAKIALQEQKISVVNANLAPLQKQAQQLAKEKEQIESEYKEKLKIMSGQTMASELFRHPQKPGKWMVTSLNAYYNGDRYNRGNETVITGIIRRVTKEGGVDDSKSPESFQYNLNTHAEFPLESA